ncbi:MAG: DUF1729 domain-containing protein [Deltaproteobacteria bacterium]|nr:DUF1729 domain-containing protein [Deltaproteobacteria bacterium]
MNERSPQPVREKTMEMAMNERRLAPVASAFLTQVRDGQIVPLIQFGGNAGNYWPELASAYQESLAARMCIERVAHVLKAEAASQEMIASGHLTHGLDVLTWISDPARLPPNDYLSASVVSQPLIFLTQVANVLRTLDGRKDADTLLERAAGFLGHSQGVMTAVCFALGFPARNFTERAEQFAIFFFWQGLRMQQAFPPDTIPPDLLASALEAGEGAPSPMAAIRGFTVAETDAIIAEFNKRMPPYGKIYRDLIHAWNWIVVGGPVGSLLRLRAMLKSREAAWAKDPIDRRKLGWQYLPTSAPFHTPYMARGLEPFRVDLKRLGFSLHGRDLKRPVFATDNGRNLQASRSLMDELLRMEWSHPVDWPKVVAAAIGQTQATHVVDFGPEDASVKLTGMNAEGRGVAMIAAATPTGRKVLFAPDAEQIPCGEDWQRYRPRTVKVADRAWLDNKFTRFTKFPPIFGGGMTPTSVETEIVTAAANAGFLVEWAGGGQVTETIWRERLDELRRDLKPGRGVVFNTLFLDPYLWNLHYPKIIALKKEGYPIIGLTISAGLPDVEKAAEILRELNAAGIWMNAFKPGSDSMIAHFLDIADANPQYTILMHVEGGKAGGHHSWEDISGLITRNYAKIRRRKNVVLCIGGGIATPEEATAWLLGTWQTHPDLSPMPVDAVFLGTRLMAVKEAKTSPQVKQLLAKIGGTHEWVRKLEVKGGVTSQESQLGADVHFAENAAAKAGALLDKFAGKPLEEILRHKTEIIAALNKTAKPYFGDLEQMTYGQVLQRMTELMAPGKIPAHLPHDGPWFDVTFRQRADAWEERMRARGATATTILHPEDVDYFLYLCRLPGKPVNFVPAIDENVRRWYKADSLWQSHDPRYPADAVFTIPGPEAVRGITKTDEPVAEVLGTFEETVVKALGRPDPKTIISYAGQAPSPWGAGAVAAALTSEWIALTRGGKGGAFIPNPIPRLFPAHDDPAVRVIKRQGRVVEVRTQHARLLERNERVLLELRHQPPGNHRIIPLRLEYVFHPDCGWAPLHLNEQERDAQIAAFYGALWNVKGFDLRKRKQLAIGQTFRSETLVTRAAIEAYSMATGASSISHDGKLSGTPAMAIVHAWGAFAQCLLACGMQANLLDLLHLSNTFRFLTERPIVEGERIVSELTIERIEPRGTGIVIGVGGHLMRGKKRVAEMTSEFYIRHAARILDGQGSATSGRVGLALRGSAPLSLARGDVGTMDAARSGYPSIADPGHQGPRQVVPLPVPFDVASGTMTAPPTAEAYALASHDSNPIHTDPRIAAVAGLDGPIMHGMWSNAALLREATRTIAQGEPDRIMFARAQFTQPVKPGESLTYASRQVGMANGARVIDATLSTERGPAIAAQLHIREGRTAYLFTGQGSQVPGMGMEGYARSAAARAVWDAADAYCRKGFGFSILHVVKENPRELLVQGVRLKHPQGVLNLTQFTQVALSVLAMAQVAELKEAGCYDEAAMYAGHSLGEYAALSATGILPLEQVVAVVYHRGLTMQHFVPRDAHGVSPYGMAVVRPNLVGLTDAELQQLVRDLVSEHKGNLEIVNFNIAGEQYSVTGETRVLAALRERLQTVEKGRGVWRGGISRDAGELYPKEIRLWAVDQPIYSEPDRRTVPMRSRLPQGGLRLHRKCGAQTVAGCAETDGNDGCSNPIDRTPRLPICLAGPMDSHAIRLV